MTELRKTTSEMRSTLKAAVRRVLSLAGGGDSVQYATRVKAPALSRYGSTHLDHVENHCPIDVAMDLDLEAGQPVILAALAKAQGYELVPVAAVEYEDVPWSDKLCMGYRATARVFGAIDDALADGKIDAAEVPGILREMDQDDAIKRRIRARIEAEGKTEVPPVRMVGGARS